MFIDSRICFVKTEGKNKEIIPPCRYVLSVHSVCFAFRWVTAKQSETEHSERGGECWRASWLGGANGSSRTEKNLLKKLLVGCEICVEWLLWAALTKLEKQKPKKTKTGRGGGWTENSGELKEGKVGEYRQSGKKLRRGFDADGRLYYFCHQKFWGARCWQSRLVLGIRYGICVSRAFLLNQSQKNEIK